MLASKKYINLDIQSKYEFFDYGHALEILHESFPEEWKEIQVALRQLKLTLADISKAGGNESPIPKKFDDALYPRGWREIRISGDLIVKKYPRQAVFRYGRSARFRARRGALERRTQRPLPKEHPFEARRHAREQHQGSSAGGGRGNDSAHRRHVHCNRVWRG